MIRTAARGALVLVLFAAVLDASLAQPTNPDRVYYRDKKDGSLRNSDGEVKSGPTGFQLVSGKTVVALSPLDIVRVVPGDMPPLDRKDIQAQLTLEERKEWGKARDGYDAMKKAAKGATDKSKRFLEYKLAVTTARAADDAKDVESWKPRAEEAVGLLESFLADSLTGWEAWAATQASANLQAELGKFDAVAKLWEKIGATAQGELKNEAVLNEIDAKLRGKRYEDVKAMAEKQLAAVREGPVKQRLAIYQIAGSKALTAAAEGVTLIEAEIAKTQDAAVRATGYSVIGELHLVGEKPNARDAMWSFLWVEVVYNQDKDEVLTALVRLATVFALQGDEERAKAYHEKARRLRASQG